MNTVRQPKDYAERSFGYGRVTFHNPDGSTVEMPADWVSRQQYLNDDFYKLQPAPEIRPVVWVLLGVGIGAFACFLARLFL